jgi:periplasmic protein TonB
MPEAGFFEQKSGSPTGFTLVVVAHVAALGALALAKGPEFIRPLAPPLVITPIPLPDDPPPVDRIEPRRPEQPSRVTVPPTPTPTPVTSTFPTTPQQPFPTAFDSRPPGTQDIRIARVELPPPVRREAEMLSRDLQPPYPSAEQRMQRDGIVRIRVTIGADGRVTAAERVSATSDAFWRATERQALSRWRFRPATVDGRPVETTRVITVTFRIDNADV